MHYRSLAVCSLGAWSPLLPAGCHVSGGTHAIASPIPTRRRLRGSHPLAVTRSSGLRLTCVPAARRLPPPPTHSSNPPQASPAGYAARGVWAPPRSLAATKGILSVPRGTEMFQFPRCPLRDRSQSARPCAGRVAPFGHPRIAGCQRLPGAFRRVAASFLGRQRQGIHHAPIMRIPLWFHPASVAATPDRTRQGTAPPQHHAATARLTCDSGVILMMYLAVSAGTHHEPRSRPTLVRCGLGSAMPQSGLARSRAAEPEGSAWRCQSAWRDGTLVRVTTLVRSRTPTSDEAFHPPRSLDRSSCSLAQQR